jgi:hypothetical protein
MQALFVNMDTYLQGLFSLANDPAAEVRKLVKEFEQQQIISLLIMFFLVAYILYGLCKVNWVFVLCFLFENAVCRRHPPVP